MKIQTKLIDGKMMGREEKDFSDLKLGGSFFDQHISLSKFNKENPWLPAPAFDKEDVWEAEIVWQHYSTGHSEWYDCHETYDKNLAEYCGDKTRQIYIPKEVKKENMEKTPLELIADERVRKAAVYGYDDKAIIERTEDYGNNELADAAASYCLSFRDDTGKPCVFWPWDKEYFKASPDDRIKELVKAGAFIVDEIMRLQANHLK